MFHRLPLAALAASAFLTHAACAVETSVNVPVSDLRFSDAGVGPLKVASGFGDIGKGAHGSFVKFPAGYATPLHSHSEDYYGVVISGVVANEASASAKDRPLPPGSYWFQKGKTAHVTRCISTTECVLFISQKGRFDFVDAH